MTRQESGTAPDIYYIILDSYARADVLQELYGYDNGSFLSELARRGFYIAEDSHANYSQTYLSLASSLNMSYLGDVARDVPQGTHDRMLLADMIRDACVIRLLKAAGYRYIVLTSGFGDTWCAAADLHIRGPWTLSLFQNELINSTPISRLSGLQYDLHRASILYSFAHLPNVARTKSPKFVFAHIFCPHPPFVFGAHGENTRPDRVFAQAQASYYQANRARHAEYITGYRDQLAYTNALSLAMVDAILANSPQPPIIILQADHGPESALVWADVTDTGLRERMSILNAYYLPGDGEPRLYASMTPVNTFRVVLNRYLGADFELLPDRVQFSTWDRPYQFTDVTERLRLDTGRG